VGPLRLHLKWSGARITRRQIASASIGLPRTRSYPVADALIAKGVPFLSSTGYGAQGIEEGYRDRPVVTKPIQFEKLTEILRSLLPR
jgi:hypothetical protein